MFTKKVISIIGAASFALAPLPTIAQESTSNMTLDEVIVTAQFREERLQDTGLAIDVIGSEEINQLGLNNGIDLESAVPALAIRSTGGSSVNLLVRGVGNTTTGPATDAAVTFNYDGVAVARGAGAFGALFDLERVEVLKGPQGTLYGKNSTGGIVNVVPVKPEVGEGVSGFINGSIGNYSATDFTAAANFGLSDTFALRVSANVVNRDGYNSDGSSDVDNTNARIQMLFEPNDEFSIRLAADYGSVGGSGISSSPYVRYTDNGPGAFIPTLLDLPINAGPNAATTDAIRSTVLLPPAFAFQAPIDNDLFLDRESYGIHAEIIAELGAGTLTVIPAYRENSTLTKLGTDGYTSILSDEENDQISLETRFAGSAGRLDYIVGAHYLDENITPQIAINLQSVLPLVNVEFENESTAFFAEGVFNINDTTRIVAGVRTTDDDKTIVGNNDTFILSCGVGPVPTPAEIGACLAPGASPILPSLPGGTAAYLDYFAQTPITIPGVVIPAGPGTTVRPLFPTFAPGAIIQIDIPISGATNTSEPTYKLSLEKDLSDDTLFYGTFARGYRAGGFDPSGNSFEPEYLDAFTFGLKSQLNDTLQINAEVFHWDYTDQQISYNTINDQGAAESITQNVGEATIAGAEIDLKWLASENTLIDATVQYLDSSYDNLNFITTTSTINCPFELTGDISIGAGGPPAPILNYDCSGTRAAYSPELVATFGIQQTFPLDNGYRVIAGLNTTYTDEQQSGFQNRVADIIDSQTRTDLNVTLESPDANWFVSLWARNLEDENRVLSVLNPLSEIGYAIPGIDRTYGIRFGMNH